MIAASLGVAGCNDDDTTPAAPPPDLGGAPKLPVPTFITQDPAFTDYRPAVDKTGTQVVFERTPVPNPQGAQDTLLYIATGMGTPAQTVAKLLPAPPPNPSFSYPFAQTRPDWNWKTGALAFNGAPSNGTEPVQVHLLTDGVLSLVPSTRLHFYPIWTSQSTASLIVYNSSDTALPAPPAPQVPSPPVTALIGLDGGVLHANLNGNDANNIQVYGGFASPNPNAPTQIVYAGQPALSNWGVSPPVPNAPPAYNQDRNYIFINTLVGGVYTSAPLEQAASITTYDPAYQGRAPYWSPDGTHVVFESSRAGGYALFLVNVAAGTPPVQLTDPQYWAQHAKFLPGGTQLVYTSLQQRSTTGAGPRGIALIDITQYL